MSTINSCTITDPFGAEATCAKFTIDDLAKAFKLAGTTVVGLRYTLSLWVKSEATGSLIVYSKECASSTEWVKYVITFTATSENLMIGFNNTGTYYIYHPQLELGNKATDWKLSPEDVDEQISNCPTREEVTAAITASRKGIELNVSTYYTSKTEFENIENRVKTAEAAIKLNTDNIELSVKEADVTGNYLISKINLDSTAATIEAKHINLTGYVTMTDLEGSGTTKINGNNITTGTIGADRIDVNSLFSKTVSATNLTVTGNSKLSGVTATDLTVTGNSTFTGTITGSEINSSVINTTDGNFETEISGGLISCHGPYAYNSSTTYIAQTIYKTLGLDMTWYRPSNTSDRYYTYLSPTGISIQTGLYGDVLTANFNMSTKDISVYTDGTFNAYAIYENGTALSSKYAPALHTHPYLPLSGGTMTGHLVLGANVDLYMTYDNTNYPVVESPNNGNIMLNACGGGLYLGYSNTTEIVIRNDKILKWMNTSGTAEQLLRFNSSNLFAVGNTNYTTAIRGSSITSNKTITVSSDRAAKHDIDDISQNMLDAFMELRLVQFRYNDDSEKLNAGLIYQEAKETFEKHGIYNFAGIRDPFKPITECTEEDIEDGAHFGAIAYDQFQNIHMAVTQKHHKYIMALNLSMTNAEQSIEQLKHQYLTQEERMQYITDQLQQALTEIGQLQTQLKALA